MEFKDKEEEENIVGNNENVYMLLSFICYAIFLIHREGHRKGI